MSKNDARECVLEGSRPRWAAMLMLAFAASACSGTGVDQTVFDEAVLDEAVLDEAGLDEPASDDTLPLEARLLESSDGTEPADPTELNEGLTGRSFANSVGTYRWRKGEPARVLMSAQTHFCALSMIRGHFGSETVISVDVSNGNWVIAGATQAAGLLEFDAVCVQKSAFLTNRGTNWQLNDGHVAFNASNFPGIDPMLSFTAPVLSTIHGAFNGWGEKVWVETWGPNLLFQNGTAPGWHLAKAHALNFGRDKAPVYTRDFDIWATPDNQQSDAPHQASLNTSFCFIHSLSGKLRGQGEWAQVYPHFATNTWAVAARAGADGKIRANIQCLSSEQR